MRIAGAFAAACLAVATYATTPAAQTGGQTQAPPQGPQATFRAATNLVEVDVVVLDKDGRFVPGLTMDDLEVFEDGKRQVVQQFYLVSSAMAGASGRTETEQRPAPGDPRGRRIFVFLFDEGHMSTESLTRVKVGVERFLGTQFAPGDIGGVFMNNAMYRGRLTTSKVELVSAIRAVVPAFDNRDALLMPFRDFPQIPGEADAVRIDYGDRRLLDELTARACERNAEECARAGGTGQVHNQIEDKAKQYVRDARVQTSQTVRNLNTIATNLSRNHFRSQKRRRLAYEAVTAVAVEADGVGPDAGLIGGEVGAAIEAVVTRLPFKQRVAFLQRKIHGLDYASIGQALQCSAESARAHVFQALRKIRQALDGQALPETKESQR